MASEFVHDAKHTTIELTSDLGLSFSGTNPRIKHTGSGTFTIQSTIGKINVTSGSSASDSLNLDSAGGIDMDGAGIVSIETSDTSESAITLTSTSGGVNIDAAPTKDVDISGGQVFLSSKDNIAGAISLTTNVGTTETIVVTNTLGTSVMTDGNSNAAIQLHSSAGGIGLRSTANLAGSIQIEADGGINETIIIHSDQGTSTSSISLVSDVGGISMTVNGTSAITIENDATVGINTNNPNNTYALDVNGTTNTTGVYQSDNLLMPPGCIIPYAAASSPGGWLLCDGSAVSRTTYAALFAIISTTYGVGNGSTTFNVPDITGRLIVGLDSGDSDFNALGETGGSKNKTLSTTEIPSHSHSGTIDSNGSHTHTGTTNSDGSHAHTITDPGHSHNVSGTLETTGSGTSAAQDATTGEPNVQSTVTTTSSTETTGISINSGGAHTHGFTTNSGGSHTHTFTGGTTGGGNSFSLMNPYFTLNYIIKV